MPSNGFVRASELHPLSELKGQPLLLLGAVWLLLAMPPIDPWLRASMWGHMLVQIPLLVASGVALAHLVLQRLPRLTYYTTAYRWPLMLCVIFTLMIWMLPRLLDLAVQSELVNVVKLLSLTLLGGLPLGLAWRSLGPVARGLLHVEALATVWRIGWLYLDSPSRLCTQYLLNDQIRLGHWLLIIGCAYAGWLVVVALTGKQASE